MYFLGIDLGTSSVKIIIMDESGKVVNTTTKNFEISYPHIGWAEQNPDDWWDGTKEGIKEIIKLSGLKSDEIKGIGFSGQMHGLVLLDKENKVLMPAILWCDQRTQEECDYLNNVIGQDKLSKYTANMSLTGFTAPKVLWVKKHKPDIYNKIYKMMLPKDYIRFKLTGLFATDVSDASGTLMFDVKNRKWSKEMLNILEIDEEVLPKVFESYQVTGRVSIEAAKVTGLSTETLVVAGAGDQAAGAVGTGTVDSGVVSVALGTSGVVFACDKKFSVDSKNRLHSFCHANGRYHQMGVMLSAASCLQWWNDNINLDTMENSFEVLLTEAENSVAGSKGLIYLPYLMGERTPYSDPDAKGSFIGLNITHTRGDMTRSILEGVCFGLRDSLEILKSMGVEVKEVRVSGGGSKSTLWKQILASVFNLKVSSINSKEGPAYGAAILAAVGCGLYDNVDDACNSLIKITDTIMPIEKDVDKYDKTYKIYASLYGCLKDKFKELSELASKED
ncbi:xylulokinase [Clostridium estertheticum]|uniref:xylulokinase n=1 Tax=Clostridium estertheticum TaxID=238834 RepID=UPI001CF30727|nr:xylulokinase [Clostridium estertheticum]MCB2307909.1 xylulokinase [Clostridium estertheticum]MCB2346033.1 xylulokinase [Clostridium estertheticum]MCB2351291.1 xylulokinase [Clostridium estertheticum]WAG44179.1 xylulokinase [Clostridium estertheticum]